MLNLHRMLLSIEDRCQLSEKVRKKVVQEWVYVKELDRKFQTEEKKGKEF